MNVQQTNEAERRPQPDEKVRRQRIAKTLLDLQNIVPKPDEVNEEGGPSPRKVSDAIEILEDTVDYIKILHQEHPIDIQPEAETCDVDEEESMQGVLLQPVIPGCVTLSPINQSGTKDVLAGFHDCTAEVIRYLIEVEKLSDSNPIVMGLRQHLLEKERTLNVENLLQYSENSFSHEIPLQCQSNPGYTGTTEVVTEVSSQVKHEPLEPLSAMDSSDQTLVPQTVCVDSIAHPALRYQHYSAFNLFDSLPNQSVLSSTADPLCRVSEALPIGHSVYLEDQSKSVPCDSSMLDLQQLAENNPEIACLTEEILSLLEDGDISLDEDSDDDFDTDIEQ